MKIRDNKMLLMKVQSHIHVYTSKPLPVPAVSGDNPGIMYVIYLY